MSVPLHYDRANVGRIGRHISNLAHDMRPFESPDLSGSHVLIIDDDEDAREVIRRILTDSGAEVTSVASAAEAVFVIGQINPSVIVSDIGMPEVDGYQLMRQIRSLPPERGGKIPAIALTAFARPQDQDLALAAGYHAHVAKPVEPAELLSVLVSVLVSVLQKPASESSPD